VPADLPAEDPADEATLTSDSVVNPDGVQIDSYAAASAFPGTRDNVVNVFFPDGQPGSTLRFETGLFTIGYTMHVYEVPASDAFLPVNFS
jgi:hypothetical protein